MKTFKISLAIVMAVFSSVTFAQAKQTVKHETVKVWGNCETCEGRIEKAAKAAGASTAKWNVDTKMLAVAYNPAKASMEKIEKAVAAAGYDTNNQKANEQSYKKLPECCQYERKEGGSSALNVNKE